MRSSTSNICELKKKKSLLRNSRLLFQLVHGPSTKTRVAYILSLLREPAEHGNESTVLEEDESDVEDEDVTMLDTEVTFSASRVNVQKAWF